MSRSKKEIDKELMYKKLMPSGLKTIKRAPNEDMKPETAAPIKEILGSQDLRPQTPAAHKPPAPRPVSVPALDNQQMVVVNAMESIVLQKLDSVLERFKCCRCDRCKKDIVALALNKLPPKYMVLAEGQTAPDITPQVNAQVITAMIQAVIKVRESPRH